jgi:hypothetical protein
VIGALEERWAIVAVNLPEAALEGVGPADGIKQGRLLAAEEQPLPQLNHPNRCGLYPGPWLKRQDNIPRPRGSFSTVITHGGINHHLVTKIKGTAFEAIISYMASIGY